MDVKGDVTIALKIFSFLFYMSIHTHSAGGCTQKTGMRRRMKEPCGLAAGPENSESVDKNVNWS